MSLTIKNLCETPEYKTLFKSMKHYYSLQAQTDFLQQCRDNNLIPNGIADQCKFHLSYLSPDLEVLLNNMFNFAKSRAFDIILQDYSVKTKKLKHTFFSQIDHLKAKYGPPFLEVLHTFNCYFTPITSSLHANHHKN